jgi:large subunit ribosomal protein L35
MKTSSGAKKKFKVTSTGKILRRNAGQSHNFENQSPKQKRAFNKDVLVAKAQVKTIKRLLGKA